MMVNAVSSKSFKVVLRGRQGNRMTPTPPSSPFPNATLVLDAASIERALKRLAHEIIESNPDLTRVALIGIPSRGVEIARRLVGYIKQFEGVEIETGVLDVAMHRDDLHTRRAKSFRYSRRACPRIWRTKRKPILTDDVLFSGRTCRAALDAISSFGRPARIQYAVLIDRGHRETADPRGLCRQERSHSPMRATRLRPLPRGGRRAGFRVDRKSIIHPIFLFLLLFRLIFLPAPNEHPFPCSLQRP